MFVNLSPYLTWLSIMLTGKARPIATPATTTTTSTTTTTTTTNSPIPRDFFECSGVPVGRYPHPQDCAKYYVCTAQAHLVRPSECPVDLYFAPTLHVCTLPEDAGCTTTTAPPKGTLHPSAKPSTTPTPGTWLSQLSRHYKAVEDDRLVIYYDSNITNPQSVLWPISFTRSMWDRVFMMYGDFGSQNRLYLLLRGRPFPEDLHYSSYLDSENSNINSIEVGSQDWSVESPSNKDLITRNLAQIISKSARGVRYSGPERYWNDIFVYDLYARSGRIADRDRWAEKVRQEIEDNIASIPLFTQWYLFIYQMYGGGSALNRFVIAREQNFPKASGDSTTFARVMNRGEFIHFWSGSVGANLTNLAYNTVFGGSNELIAQYQKATTDFSGLSY